MPATARAPCGASRTEFWERAAREGFPDELARASAQKFRVEFEALDRRLAKQPYLLGDALSPLDIAWFIYGDDTKRNMPRRSEFCPQLITYEQRAAEHRHVDYAGDSRSQEGTPASRQCRRDRRRRGVNERAQTQADFRAAFEPRVSPPPARGRR
jgi:glutathione S-transferase